MKWLIPIVLLSISALQVEGQGHNALPFGQYETVYLGVEDGLSQGSVYSILQDSRGFMWFTSYEGINRYDGRRFEVFYPNASEAGSIKGRLPNGIVEDSLGNIWVGTEECLNQYDRKSGRFRQVYVKDSLGRPISSLHYPFYTDSVSVWYINTEEGVNRYHFREGKKELITGAVRYSRNHSRINSAARTSDGSVWVRQELGAVRVLPDGRLCSYFSTREDNVLGSPLHLVCFYEDSEERIWIGTQDTLLELLPEEERYRAIPLAQWGIQTKIGDIRESPQGHLWMGTVDRGILIYDKDENEALHTIQQGPAREISLRNNSAATLYFGRQGLCWVNNDPDGITIIKPDFSPFNRRAPFFFAQYGLASAGVRAFAEAPDGSVWIGLEQGGLCQYSPEQNRMLRIINTAQGYLFPENQCRAMVFGEDGRLWAGTQNGFYTLGLEDGQWRHIPNTAHRGRLPSSQLIWDMQAGPGGLIAFTTDLGAYLLDPQTERFQAIPNLEEISSGVLYLDEQQRLYIPEYYNGFYLISWAEAVGEGPGRPRHFLPGIYIKAFYKEPESRILWLATVDGLLKLEFNEEGTALNQLAAYAQAEGLPSSYIYSVLPDEKGHLWLSHNRGLSCFDPRAATFVNYGPEDGLQGYEYNTNAFLRSSRGELFFGGVQGFNHFFPGQVQPPPLPPAPQFTRLFVNDTLTRAFGNIGEAGAISLPYRNNTITLEFTSTNYLNPGKTVYQYYLKGQENSWIDAGLLARTRYSNLPAGRYTFFVRAGNQDGLWNPEAASLEITIYPPWWRSWWAYLCYALLLTGLGYALFANRLRARLRKAEAARYEELNRWKSEFYANITHEFRTPLSLILGMAGRLPAENQERNIIQQNGQRLLSLVNQLLELNKLKDGALEVEWSRSDFMHFLRTTATPFRLMAREKGIKMQIQTEPEALNMDFDPEKMASVLENLFSNAIKFCKKGDSILVKAWYSGQNDTGSLEIEVRDSGPGIAPEAVEQIFNRYYRGSPLRGAGDGTGIGLTLVRELASLMNG
ncbi:MAG: hypothetical protein KDD06_29410, partial [Phaeodactylibacter sp.]|nr:hypothetical protein [Phaeodactylibacter sp.]